MTVHKRNRSDYKNSLVFSLLTYYIKPLILYTFIYIQKEKEVLRGRVAAVGSLWPFNNGELGRDLCEFAAPMFINNISRGEGYLLKQMIFMRLPVDCVQWINLTSLVVTVRVNRFIAAVFAFCG